MDDLLSQTLLSIQNDIREFRTMLTDISKTMVFKEDFVRLEQRVVQLEANRLPSWSIPLAAVVVAISAIVASHFWR